MTISPRRKACRTSSSTPPSMRKPGSSPGRQDRAKTLIRWPSACVARMFPLPTSRTPSNSLMRSAYSSGIEAGRSSVPESTVGVTMKSTYLKMRSIHSRWSRTELSMALPVLVEITSEIISTPTTSDVLVGWRRSWRTARLASIPRNGRNSRSVTCDSGINAMVTAMAPPTNARTMLAGRRKTSTSPGSRPVWMIA